MKEIALNSAKYDGGGAVSEMRRKRLGIWQPSCPTADRAERGVTEPDYSGLWSEQSGDLSS